MDVKNEKFLIEGINPLIISGFGVKFGRRFGNRKDWGALMRKKNPIRGFLGCYDQNLFDGWYLPELRIYGSDGSLVKTVICKSNDHAMKLKREYTEKLNEFLSKMVKDEQKILD